MSENYEEKFIKNTKSMEEDHLKKKHIVIVLGKHIDDETNKIMKLFLMALQDIEIDGEQLKPVTLQSIKVEDTLKFETPRQKAHSLFSGAHFVVIENMCPAGQIVELEYCRNVGVMTAIVCKKDCKQSSWMTLDFPIHSNDIKVFFFDDLKLDNIRTTTNDIFDWVKNRGKERYDMFVDIDKNNRKSEKFSF